MSRKHRQRKLRARKGSRLRPVDSVRYRLDSTREFVDNARRSAADLSIVGGRDHDGKQDGGE